MSSEDIARELNEAAGRGPQKQGTGGASAAPKQKNPLGTTAEEEAELRRRYPTMFEQADEKARARGLDTERRPGEDAIDHKNRVEDERLQQMYPSSYGQMKAAQMQRESAERDREEADRELMRELYPQMHAQRVTGYNGKIVQVEVEEDGE